MSKENFSFSLFNEDGLSRVGQIHTHRGNIDTPTFMPVGTQGTIKSAFIEDVALTGAQVILLKRIPRLLYRYNLLRAANL